MKRSILSFLLSLGFYFAFGQCGPYTVTAGSYSCSSRSIELTVSGASAAQQIVWNLNGIIDTVNRGPIGLTIAGGNGSGSADDQLYFPWGVYGDRSGNIYVSDAQNNRIQKFPTGSTSATNGTTVAGGNGAGTGANQLTTPEGLFVDSYGNIYVADYYNNRIQKFAAGSTSASNGITVAGGNGQGSDSNQFDGPVGVYVDGSGNVFVADSKNNRIQEFPAGSSSATNGITVAGGNGQGIDSNQLNLPYGVYLDGSSNIYVAEYGNGGIRKFPAGSTSSTNGIIVASVESMGIYIDGSDNLYAAELDNHGIEKFPSGSTSATIGITIAAGNGRGYADNQLDQPTGVYIDSVGDIYVADNNNGRIQKWPQPPILTIDTIISVTSAGTYSAIIIDTSGCIASSNNFTLNLNSGSTISDSICQGSSYIFHGNSLSVAGTYYDTLLSFTGCDSIVTLSLTVNPNGPYTITATDSCIYSVIKVSGAFTATQIIWDLNGIFDTIYGPIKVDSGIPVAWQGGADVFLDVYGNIYIADNGNNRIQEFPVGSSPNSSGITVAGGNGQGSDSNQLYNPSGVFVDRSGNIYVTDRSNNRVQKFPPGSTSATNGTTVAGGNGIGAAANQLENPNGVYVDTLGNIYVADYNNYRIQKFPPGSTSATNGTTVAGGNGGGYGANQLFGPWGVYLDGSGNIYVADLDNFRIQKFPSGSTSATNATTVAGGNGRGSAANQLGYASGLYVDGPGNVYVADQDNSRIQEFPVGSTSATNGNTVAWANYSGNISFANQLYLPASVFVNDSGYIYVANGMGNIQKWLPLRCIDTSISVASSGSYSAIVTSASGCKTSSDTIIAHPGVTVHFTLQQSSTPHLWYIVNQSHGPGTLTYVWNWGDSATSTGDTASHTYAAAGYYNICVTATSSMGCSANYCDTNVYLFKDQSGQMINIEVLPQFPNGISEINGQSPIHLYPNPSKGSFTLETSASIGTDYIITDMLGNVIMQQSIRSDKQLIELPEVADGVYTLIVKGASPIRFVIVR